MPRWYIFYIIGIGKLQCINYLQSLGVSLYEQDAYGQTPLYYIANQNQLTLVHKYDKPEYYNHSDKLASQTPLYYAAKKGYFQMCKILVQNGCDVTHHDSHNKTAVQYARRARYHEVTQYLSNQLKKAREIKETKVQKQTNNKQNKQLMKQSKQQAKQKNSSENNKKVNNQKKDIQTQSVSNVSRSFYKIVLVNDQGEAKDLTQQQIRLLVRQKPAIQSLLANPGGIPREALQSQKQNQEKQKWQKVATRILQGIWKHKGSVWFQQPVDPVKFGILDYNDIVTHPMDLGTIKKKLQFNFYTSPQHLASDIKLVWDNCYKYNGLQHEISLSAKQLQILFNEMYKAQLKEYQKH